MEGVHLILKVKKTENQITVTDGCHYIELGMNSGNGGLEKEVGRTLSKRLSDLKDKTVYLFCGCKVVYKLVGSELKLKLESIGFNFIMPSLGDFETKNLRFLECDLHDYEKEQVRRKVS